MGATSPREQLQEKAPSASNGGGSSSSSKSSGTSSSSNSIAADGCAWSLNVGSAVAIVFVNKVLMSRQNGYAFSFGEQEALNKDHHDQLPGGTDRVRC
jgi:hypothetical protein